MNEWSRATRQGFLNFLGSCKGNPEGLNSVLSENMCELLGQRILLQNSVGSGWQQPKMTTMTLVSPALQMQPVVLTRFTLTHTVCQWASVACRAKAVRQAVGGSSPKAGDWGVGAEVRAKHVLCHCWLGKHRIGMKCFPGGQRPLLSQQRSRGLSCVTVRK